MAWSLPPPGTVARNLEQCQWQQGLSENTPRGLECRGAWIVSGRGVWHGVWHECHGVWSVTGVECHGAWSVTGVECGVL